MPLTIILIAAVSSAAGEIHIPDPRQDLNVRPSPSVGFPDPSVDLVGITFVREADHLVAEIMVDDLAFQFPGVVGLRNYIVWFHTDRHDLVTFWITSIADGRDWTATVDCYQGDNITCFETIAPTIDHGSSMIALRVPTHLLGRTVMEPFVTTSARYPFSQSMQFGVKDAAPNCDLTACPRGPTFEI